MPNKAYAILLHSEDEDNGYLYFPIKRADRIYGGMPQFFGGTKEGDETDWDTIAREMQEESDGKITLEKGGLNRIHTATNIKGDRYNFYVAERYKGNHFLGPLNNQEMASINAFFIQIGGEDDVEDLLQALKIVPTEEFVKSETYTAFNKAIEWSEGE